MNSTPTSTTPPANAGAGDEIDLLNVLIVLAKHKRQIVLATLGAAIAAALISMALPNVYLSNTRLLPPQQSQSGAAAMLAQLGGAAGALVGAAGGGKSPNDLYIGMLRSRTVLDKLIQKFDLRKVYDKESLELTRQLLEKRTTVTSGKDGIIVLAVEDHDPQRAAQLANAYVDELLALIKVLAVTEASQRRLFFERQLEASKNKLAAVEVALKRSLDTNGVINVDVESQAMMATVARLRAEVSAKEVKLNAMQAFLTPSNPEYRKGQEELQSMRAELQKLENGRSDGAGGKTTAQGLENIKLLREVKYQQMLYELLAKQYEAARLEEAKDSPLLQVLDPAIVPEKKVAPQRSVIVLAAAFLGALAAAAAAFISERRRVIAQRPEQLARWQALSGYLSFKK